MPASEILPLRKIREEVVPSVYEIGDQAVAEQWSEIYSIFGISSVEKLTAISGLEGGIVSRLLDVPQYRFTTSLEPKRRSKGKFAKHGKRKREGIGQILPAYRSQRPVRLSSHLMALGSSLSKAKGKLWKYTEDFVDHREFEFSVAEIHCPKAPGCQAGFTTLDGLSKSISFGVRLLTLGVGGGLTSDVETTQGFTVRDGSCHSLVAGFKADVYEYELRVLGRIARKGLRLKPLRLESSVRCVRLDQDSDGGCEVPASSIHLSRGKRLVSVDMRQSDPLSRGSTKFTWTSRTPTRASFTVPLPGGSVGYRLAVVASRGLSYDYEFTGGRFYAWYEAALPSAGYLWTTRP